MKAEKLFLFLAVIILAGSAAFANQGGSAGKVSAQLNVSCDGEEQLEVKLKAVEVNNGVRGKGYFRCLPEQGGRIYAKVVYVTVDGDYAWVAGECTDSDTDMEGRWFFLVAHDGGKPGQDVDHIWWDWLADSDDDEEIARKKVENLQTPSNNRPIESGDIEVKDEG